MADPLISVIVPVYKVEPYLRRCVDSILAQTLSDIEIILVDDGSPDGCPAICDSYALLDSRVKAIHKENGGLGSARNAGLDIASGRFIGFVDSDDYVSPGMFDTLYNALIKENADVCICSMEKVNEDCAPAGKRSYFGYAVITGTAALDLLYTNDYIYFTVACNKLFRRELFGTLRFPEGKLYEDGYAAFRYYFESRTVVCLPDCLYFYLTRADSITTSEISVKNLDGIDADLDSLEFLIEKGCPELVKKAQTKYVLSIINNLRRFDLGRKEVRDRFRLIKKDFQKQQRGIMKNAVLSKKEKVLMAVFGVSPRLCKCIIKMRGL